MPVKKGVGVCGSITLRPRLAAHQNSQRHQQQVFMADLYTASNLLVRDYDPLKPSLNS